MNGPPPSLAELIALGLDQDDGAPWEGGLLDALYGLLRARAGAAEALTPEVSGLRVRRSGLPGWWCEGDNLLLAAADAEVALSNVFSFRTSRGNLGIVGRGARVHSLAFPDRDSLIVIGDRAQLAFTGVAALVDGTVMIGEDTTAGMATRVDSRNGGVVIVGADGMWSNDVNVTTDDMHAIRDLKTNRRTNGFGRSIFIDRHVWLGEQVRVTGGAHIGAQTVVGFGSRVGGAPLPPNSVCVGSPARPIRLGTIWTREDLP